MSTASIAHTKDIAFAPGGEDVVTLADVLHRLGDIPLERIRWEPHPGTATEEDVVRVKCCELLDGVIVEAARGWGESYCGVLLVQILGEYLRKQNEQIAIVTSADGLTRVKKKRIRIPDVGVWLVSRFPNGKAPFSAICDIAPDWAIEILSPSNTKKEMEIKLADFFGAGTRRVWLVDPRKRTIEDWTGPEESRVLTEPDTADLTEILPGFTLQIREWFSRVDQVIDSEADSTEN